MITRNLFSQNSDFSPSTSVCGFQLRSRPSGSAPSLQTPLLPPPERRAQRLPAGVGAGKACAAAQCTPQDPGTRAVLTAHTQGTQPLALSSVEKTPREPRNHAAGQSREACPGPGRSPVPASYLNDPHSATIVQSPALNGSHFVRGFQPFFPVTPAPGTSATRSPTS